MQFRKRNQIHCDFIKIDVQSPRKSLRTSQIAKHWRDYFIHCSENLLFFSFRTEFLTDLHKRLIVYGENTIRKFNQFINRQHRVIRRCNNIIILRRNNRSIESISLWIVIIQLLQHKRAQTRPCASSQRMKNEKTLKRVSLFYFSSHFVHNFFFHFWSEFVKCSCPVVTSTSCLFDHILLYVEEVFYFRLKYLINHFFFRIDNYWSCL